MARSGAEADAGDDAWALAKRRADVIRTSLYPAAVRAATAELGVGRTTLYRFISQFRAAEVTSTLLPSRRGRPAGIRSLDAERERIFAEAASGSVCWLVLAAVQFHGNSVCILCALVRPETIRSSTR